MRLLYVHNQSDLYGASRSLLRLVTRTPGLIPHVVLPAEGPLSVALRERGIATSIMPDLAVLTRQLRTPGQQLRFSGRVVRSAWALAALARRVRAELVHTNVATVVSTGLAARIARIPHVWHVRDSFREFRGLWSPYSRYILATGDAVVCVSRSVADQFPAASPKVQVVYNGLPLDEFSDVADAEVEAFRARCGLRGVRSVGLVGRIKLQRKGQDFLVRAMAILRNRHPDVRCVIVGSPFPGNEQHLTDLRRLISDTRLEDRVILTGDVADARAAMKSLDVMVMASCEPEPFGGVVLEAMALGIPVVGTRIGGTVEQLEDGVSGLLVEPNDDTGLATALDALLSDDGLRERLSRAARERLESRFSFPIMRDRITGIYEACLRGRRLCETAA